MKKAMRLTAVALLIGLAIAANAASYDTTWTWIGGESGSWSDKDNWDIGTVPSGYQNVAFTNKVTFPNGFSGGVGLHIKLSGSAKLHLHRGGNNSTRHISVETGTELHLYEKGCLNLASDGEFKSGGGAVYCHGPDVLSGTKYKFFFPKLLDLGGFNQTITNISQLSNSVGGHELTSETPATLTIGVKADSNWANTFYGYVKGQASLCWNPATASKKLDIRSYNNDTTGDLVISNGVVDLNTGSNRAQFTKLSRAVVGPTAQLVLHHQASVSTFFAEHLVVHEGEGSRLFWGDDTATPTSTFHRVTVVAADGTATDLPPGVYGAADGTGVTGLPWMSGNSFFKVDASTTLWNTPQDGTWGDADNWSLGVPTATRQAHIIEPGGDYTVTVAEPAVSTNLTIRNLGGGTATLNVASRLESTKGIWTVGSGGKILIPEGGEVAYWGTKGEVTTKFASSTEAFKVVNGGEVEVRGRLAISNMCGTVLLGQNGSSVTSKVVIAGNGEMSFHFKDSGDSAFRMYPTGRIEVKDYGTFRMPYKTENYVWKQEGGTLDFSGHAVFNAGGMWDVCLGRGKATFRDDSSLMGASQNARLYFTADASAPTEVCFRDRACYNAGGDNTQTELRPSGGGRIIMRFDSSATHTLGYLKMGRTAYPGFVDVYISDGVVKANSTAGFNQGCASVSVNVNSFSTGHVYQTSGAFVVNGEGGGYNTQLQYGFILGDGYTSTTIRTPTVLGVYELSGGVVTNGQSSAQNSPFVLGIGRGRGEFIQTGGEFVSKVDKNRRDRVPAIFGYSNGYGYYVLSNGTAKLSSKIWVGGVSPATCGFTHASYTGTEAEGGITVAAADRTKPCSFTVSDTVVLGGLGTGSLEVGPGGTFTGTDLVLSNNTASVLRLVADDSGFGEVNLSGRLTVTDGASLVVDATGFTGANARRCPLLSCASMSGDFAPGRVTVLTDKPTEVQVSVAANGIVLRKIAGTCILLR